MRFICWRVIKTGQEKATGIGGNTFTAHEGVFCKVAQKHVMVVYNFCFWQGNPLACKNAPNSAVSSSILSYICLQNACKVHTRIHTLVMPWQCRTCSKRFREKGSLERHVRTHTGEKPYACNHCGRKFSEHGTLNRHLKAKGNQL
jgi:DNA-directed RNA polymerase subunit RPC12/RpoP